MTIDSTPNKEHRSTAPWRFSSSSPGGDKQPRTETWQNVTIAAVPHVANLALRTLLGVTVALYILNQKHALPRPLSAVVSKTLFWPTLPITVSRRLGKWMTRIDDTVVMGGAPFGFVDYPDRLYNDFGVRGVINLCEEYRGPLRKYKELGMEHLYLPTTDHFEPTVEDLIVSSSLLVHIQSARSGHSGGMLWFRCANITIPFFKECYIFHSEARSPRK